MDWVTEMFEAELTAELAKKRDQDREEFRIHLLKRGIPPLWRELAAECEACVTTFNRLARQQRVALFHEDSHTTFRVERTRPGNAVVTATLRLDGYRIDYRLTGAEGGSEQIDAVLGFAVVSDQVVMTDDRGVITTGSATRMLLQRVLFPDRVLTTPS